MALVDGGDLVVRAIKREGVYTIFPSAAATYGTFYDSSEQVLSAPGRVERSE